MRYIGVAALLCVLGAILILAWEDEPQSRHPPVGWDETLEAMQYATCYAKPECVERLGR